MAMNMPKRVPLPLLLPMLIFGCGSENASSKTVVPTQGAHAVALTPEPDSSDTDCHIVSEIDPAAGRDLGPTVYARLKNPAWTVIIHEDLESFLELPGGARILLLPREAEVLFAPPKLFPSTQMQTLFAKGVQQLRLGFVLAQIPAAIAAALRSERLRAHNDELRGVANGLLAAEKTSLSGETADRERVTVDMRLTEQGRSKLRNALLK
jgi:hypothetical protein